MISDSTRELLAAHSEKLQEFLKKHQVTNFRVVKSQAGLFDHKVTYTATFNVRGTGVAIPASSERDAIAYAILAIKSRK